MKARTPKNDANVYIRLYHDIFDMGLSPVGFAAWCGIESFKNTSSNYAEVGRRKLAAACGLSVSSLSRGIRELEKKKLITVKHKFRKGRRIASGYFVARQKGRFTMVPTSTMKLGLTGCGLMIYAYILKRMDQNRRAFPSYSKIAATVGCSRKTVIEQIKAFEELGLVVKRKYIKKNGRFGNNRYTLPEVPASFTGAKEKTRPVNVSSPSCKRVCMENTNNLIVASRVGFVKAFVTALQNILCFVISPIRRRIFSGRGWCNSDTTCTIPTFIYKRKRKRRSYTGSKLRKEDA